MNIIDEMPAGAGVRIYAEGWQSWSPTTWYARGDEAHRPAEGWQHLMRFRPGVDLPASGVQGEGLLAIDPGDGGAVRTFAATGPDVVPSIHAEIVGDRVVVRTDAAESLEVVETPGGSGRGVRALEAFGDRFGARARARVSSAAAPRVWCTWYRYFEDVTADDVRENIAAIDESGLPVDVVQIDDGWSLGTGEWTRTNPRFGGDAALADLVARITSGGRRAGIWLAPFSVGTASSVAKEHPEWLTGPAGYNWGDDLVGLDLTHPGVRDYLTRVFTDLRDLGIDYLKLDFLYAGAVPAQRHDAASDGIDAYRSGLRLIREVMGDDAYLLGCGAPILPSVGLVDAMRVSPDTFHEGGEDGSQGLRGRMSLEARAWQDRRLWTTDPDCLVARPGFALRDEWADVVLASPGIRGFSDRMAELDAHGRDLVTQLLTGGTR